MSQHEVYKLMEDGKSRTSREVQKDLDYVCGINSITACLSKLTKKGFLKRTQPKKGIREFHYEINKDGRN